MTSTETTELVTNDAFQESFDMEIDRQEIEVAWTERFQTTVVSNSETAIACIAESRGMATEVGLAIFLPSQNTCKIYQILDTPTFMHTQSLLQHHDISAVSVHRCCRCLSVLDSV